MKLGSVFLMILFFAFVATACSGAPDAERENKSIVDDDSAVSQVVLEVPTIWCWTCEPRVEASARSVEGVKKIEFYGQTVIITYDPALTTPQAIAEAIEQGGDKVAEINEL